MSVNVKSPNSQQDVLDLAPSPSATAEKDILNAYKKLLPILKEFRDIINAEIEEMNEMRLDDGGYRLFEKFRLERSTFPQEKNERIVKKDELVGRMQELLRTIKECVGKKLKELDVQES